MTGGPERMTMIQTRGGAVAVRERGAGPALVLLHATTHDGRDYDAVLAGLSRAFRAVAVDFPGHGASAPAVDPGAQRFAEVVEDVVDALGLDRVAFIGNSVGGYAAARFAAVRPARCAALVLVQTGGFIAPTLRVRIACNVFGRAAIYRRLARRFTRLYVNPRTPADEALIARVAAFGSSAAGAALAAALWRSFLDPDHDLRARASAIVAPTLIVWGSEDPVRPINEAADVARAIPGAETAVLATGHVPFVTDPAGFLAVVEPFLRRAVARAA